MIRTLLEGEPSQIFVQSMRDAGDYESELQIGMGVFSKEAIGPDKSSKQSVLMGGGETT